MSDVERELAELQAELDVWAKCPANLANARHGVHLARRLRAAKLKQCTTESERALCEHDMQLVVSAFELYLSRAERIAKGVEQCLN